MPLAPVPWPAELERSPSTTSPERPTPLECQKRISSSPGRAGWLPCTDRGRPSSRQRRRVRSASTRRSTRSGRRSTVTPGPRPWGHLPPGHALGALVLGGEGGSPNGALFEPVGSGQNAFSRQASKVQTAPVLGKVRPSESSSRPVPYGKRVAKTGRHEMSSAAAHANRYTNRRLAPVTPFGGKVC